ncbi:DeoR/GlpR family DNA-binding transcription regulator [Neobacillus rhizophilus]|uniref:DeoR/GlpR transcriptional regulator n=1 Tax=Neobacillus rhizophilus TaxID=2833579 RepID=A0A942YVT5_9BACI|nr:DeoR/GlpR family DNA-binding transcription regulator [Neobacillus rhizophilus]MBS4214272.1 DeoR/GlpR transcriptional regulator [Neobacillus rhizophilus]MBU8915939.1 DeoR/GlpR family DNA-binding transcription regulator [Bacillus sp. FJAT-29953]
MLQEQRHHEIETFLKRQKAVKAAELASLLDVSIDTIRRDLEVLEKKGIVKRVHGGAILKQKEDTALNKLFNEREVKHLEKKKQLALVAVELIEEGQAIALNGGTTTIELAKVLADKFERLTIITNDLRIVSILGKNKHFNIILSGGFYNPEESTLYGKQCEDILSNFNIDIAFITVNALSFEHGLTDFRIHEVGVIQSILSRSKYKVVVADSSKFETNAYINICPLENIDLIVTDSALPSIIEKEYSEHHIQILTPHSDLSNE